MRIARCTGSYRGVRGLRDFRGVRRWAFTMLEIVIAMAIFAIGFVAVAAIFPVAVTLQKQTMQDVDAQQVARNAEAILRSLFPTTQIESASPSGLAGSDPYWIDTHATWLDGVRPLPFSDPPRNVMGDNASGPLLTVNTRSYPAAEAVLANRSIFWVPMARRRPGASVQWDFFVFVLAKNRGQVSGEWDTASPTDYTNANPYDEDAGLDNAVPLLRRETLAATSGSKITLSTANLASQYFRPGDWLLDSDGNDYRVTSIDAATNSLVTNVPIIGSPRHIWYGRASAVNAASPLRLITRFVIATETASPPSTSPVVDVVVDNDDTVWAQSIPGSSDSDPLPTGDYTDSGAGWAGGGIGVNSNNRYNQVNAAYAGDTCTWTISNLEPGIDYAVYATWPVGGTQSSVLRFRVENGDGTDPIAPIRVNHSALPTGPAPPVGPTSTPFALLTNFTPTGPSIRVIGSDYLHSGAPEDQLAANINNYIRVDAIWVKRITP